MRKKKSGIFLLCVCGLIAQRTSRADGRILIQSPAQATAAIMNGNLMALSGSMLLPPQNSAGSLTIATSGSSGGTVYNFGVDPDLTNNSMNITLEIPQLYSNNDPNGIQDFAIELEDKNGNMRTWEWDTTALTQGEQNFDFRFTDGRNAAGSTSFIDTGLDLTHVQEVQFSFDGIPQYPNQGSPFGLQLQVDSIVEVPEPAETLALALGTAGTMGWAWGGRSRQRTRRKVRTGIAP